MQVRPHTALEQLAALAMANQPTERHTAVRLPKITTKLAVTESFLPLDRLGRPYLVSFERWTEQGLLWDNTVYQVWQMVEDYHRYSKACYPLEIVLCARRYFVRRCDYFYPLIHSGAKRIPFKYEDSNASYEILVRGARQK